MFPGPAQQTAPGANFPLGLPILSMAVGDTFSDGSGGVYLQSGKVVSPTDAPKAALLDHLKVFGLVASGTNVLNALDLACDPTGQYWIACTSDATNVLRSADGGATWANVAHNLGTAASSVVYGGGLFVVAGSDGSTIKTSRSTNGAAFTANTSTAVTSGAPGSVKIRYGNSLFFVVCGSSGGTGDVSTSPDGITFTARNSGVAHTTPSVCWVPSASLWLITDNPASAYQTTPTGVTGTYTTRTGPVGTTATSSVVATSANVFVFLNSNSQYYSSTDAINWTTRAGPYGATNSGYPPQTGFARVAAGTIFLTNTDALGQIFVSTDGFSWSSRWLANASRVGICMVANGKLVHVSTDGTVNSLYSTNWSTCDFVGTTRMQAAINASGVQNYSSPIVYYKIKD